MVKRPFLFAVLCAFSASGATITIDSVDYSRGGSVNFLEKGTAVDGYAGAILGRYDGGPTSTFFCVDLFTNISYGTYGSTTVFPRPWRNEDRVAWLYVTQLSSITSAELGEGLQLAIWDIVHDNGDGPGTGSVAQSGATPSAVVDAWINFLALSDGQTSTQASIYRNTILADGSPAQNLIGPLSPDTITENPEPAAWLLLCSGLGLIGASRFRVRG